MQPPSRYGNFSQPSNERARFPFGGSPVGTSSSCALTAATQARKKWKDATLQLEVGFYQSLKSRLQLG